jgi:F-box and leucine-rich repeat protein 2/20
MSRLFGVSDESVVPIIMSWLDLRDYGLLDLALTNVVERKRWMICISLAQLKSNLGTIQCTHSLLRWLIKRKMQPEVIRCCYPAVIDDRSFVGIDNNSLHTIHLSNNDITDTGLLMIAQGCSQLEDITLSYCKRITDKGLLALAVHLPGITSISLSHLFEAGSFGVFAMASLCPALQTFYFYEIGLKTDDSVAVNDSIMAMARGCPKLQTMSLANSQWVSDQSVAFLAERCKELRSVCLHGCNRVTDETIKAIANSCPDLEKLDIAGLPTDGSYGTLRTSKITDESFVIVGEKCSKLVGISIASNKVTDIGIAALARGCPQLRSFSANDCPSISTAGIMALSHGCKELRTVKLEDCKCVRNDCLFRIGEGCPELTSLTLSSNDLVTNAGISRITGGCEKLTSITINDCDEIDDTALIAVGSSCPNLLEIVIGSNLSSRNFSNRGLIAVACGCPALESISISNCPHITDAGVIVLAQKCFQLKSISLRYSKITDVSVIAFATNSRKLLSVLFHRCDCITSTGLSVLAAECTQMQSMNFKISSEKVMKENLLSLRRKYLLANSGQNGVSEHNHHTSPLSMLRYFISRK